MPVSDDQLLGGAIYLATRLRDHIDRLDSGRMYAADDIAVTLRALICSGQGCAVLQRLANAHRVKMADIDLSKPPELTTEVISLGGLPTIDTLSADLGGVTCQIAKLSSARVVSYFDHGRIVRFTWGELISKYANKWGGAHLDEEVPPALRVLDLHAVGNLSLPAYLLRCVGVAVWYGAQELFSRLLDRVGSGYPVVQAPGADEFAPLAHPGMAALLYMQINKFDGHLIWHIRDPNTSINLGRIRLGGVDQNMLYEPGSGDSAPVYIPVGGIGSRVPLPNTRKNRTFDKTFSLTGRLVCIKDPSDEVNQKVVGAPGLLTLIPHHQITDSLAAQNER